jgi:hypothetical protein
VKIPSGSLKLMRFIAADVISSRKRRLGQLPVLLVRERYARNASKTLTARALTDAGSESFYQLYLQQDVLLVVRVNELRELQESARNTGIKRIRHRRQLTDLRALVVV